MILMRWLPEIILVVLIIWVYYYQIRIPLKNNQPLFPMFRKKRNAVDEQIIDLHEEIAVAEKEKTVVQLQRQLREIKPVPPVNNVQSAKKAKHVAKK